MECRTYVLHPQHSGNEFPSTGSRVEQEGPEEWSTAGEGDTEFENTFERILRGVDFHVYSNIEQFINTLVLSFRFCWCFQVMKIIWQHTEGTHNKRSQLTRQTLSACVYWTCLNWNRYGVSLSNRRMGCHCGLNSFSIQVGINIREFGVKSSLTNRNIF